MRFFLVLSAFSALCLPLSTLCVPLHAQMILPGAVNAPAQTKVKLPGQKSGAAKARVVFSRIPGDEAVLGRVLVHNGSAGALEFTKGASGLSISKLTLAGNMISRPGDSCSVQVVAANASPLTPTGQPEGLLRYQNAIPACRFSLDILQGAVIIKSETEICKFEAADCQARPNGMWGPRGSAIPDDQIKADNSARPLAETALRASYKNLMEKRTDRASTRLVAAEQAAFSSIREELCRDYALEDKHGFCDTRFTEAKVASIRLRLGEKPEADAGATPDKPKKRKPRRIAPPPLTMDAPSF